MMTRCERAWAILYQTRSNVLGSRLWSYDEARSVGVGEMVAKKGEGGEMDRGPPQISINGSGFFVAKR